MAQIREIKERIKSIESTKKVTHAMELVSAAKMRKSQQAALSARPYSATLHGILSRIKAMQEIFHPFLVQGYLEKEYLILITSDRGLAGGLNINLFREVLKIDLKNIVFITVGKKALNFATRTGCEILASFGSEEVPFLELARRLTKISIDGFLKGEIGKVSLLYPHFESTIKQTPKWKQVLPLRFETEEEASKNGNLLFEPSAEEILDSILPHHILTHIYQVLLEAKASEHSARMVAMKNATDAADDLVDDLTLTFNQARQEAITKELLDIVTAQRAFE